MKLNNAYKHPPAIRVACYCSVCDDSRNALTITQHASCLCTIWSCLYIF